jgi:hypothetical protein
VISTQPTHGRTRRADRNRELKPFTLAIVRTGDPIVLDVPGRRIDVDIPAEELAARVPEPATVCAFAAPARGLGAALRVDGRPRRTPAPTSTSRSGGSGAASPANLTDRSETLKVSTY